MEVDFLLHRQDRQIRYNGSNTDMMVGTLFLNNTPIFIYGGWEGYYSIHKHVVLPLR